MPGYRRGDLLPRFGRCDDTSSPNIKRHDNEAGRFVFLAAQSASRYLQAKGNTEGNPVRNSPEARLRDFMVQTISPLHARLLHHIAISVGNTGREDRALPVPYSF